MNIASLANEAAVHPSSFMCESKISHSSGDIRKEKGTLRRFSRGIRGLPLGREGLLFVLSFTLSGGAHESKRLYTLWSGRTGSFLTLVDSSLDLFMGTPALTMRFA